MAKIIWDAGLIKQIVPAEGWYAVYKLADGSRRKSRVALWALAGPQDGEEFDDVTGLDVGDVGIDACKETKNFEGYIHSSNPDFDRIPEWAYLGMFEAE
jgi:hypothetical protein